MEHHQQKLHFDGVVGFVFDFSSNNSYFAYFMLKEFCAKLGAKLKFFPLYLGALFRQRAESEGRESHGASHGDVKTRYLFLDHERWVKRTGLQLVHPSIESG